MLDLRLRYKGGGIFESAFRLDYELAEQKYQPGELLRVKVSHPRSVQQNEFFHAIIQAAWENQRAGPKLPTWRHLKAWLLIEIGHCDVIRFSQRQMTNAAFGQLVRALRQRYDAVGAKEDRETGDLLLCFAKSVAFNEVPPGAMNEIVDRVVAIICTDIVPGLDPASLLNMARARTAFRGGKHANDGVRPRR